MYVCFYFKKKLKENVILMFCFQQLNGSSSDLLYFSLQIEIEKSIINQSSVMEANELREAIEDAKRGMAVLFLSYKANFYLLL